MERSFIRGLMAYKYKLSYNIEEASENNCRNKGEGAVDEEISTRRAKYPKIINEKESKTINCKTMLLSL